MRSQPPPYDAVKRLQSPVRPGEMRLQPLGLIHRSGRQELENCIVVSVRNTIFAAAILTCFSGMVPALAQGMPERGGMEMGMSPPAAGHPDREDRKAWHERFCTNHYAGAAARLAFVEAKLDLSQDQKPAFDKWRDSVLKSAKAHESACLAHAGEAAKPHTVLDREAWMEKMMEARLAALRAERPDLEALYGKLNPEQKATFDRMGEEWEHHHWMHHRHFEEHEHEHEHEGEEQ
jgi:hypothetical protein